MSEWRVMVDCPCCDRMFPVEAEIDPDVGVCFDVPVSCSCHEKSDGAYTEAERKHIAADVEEAVRLAYEDEERDFNDMADHPDSPR